MSFREQTIVRILLFVARILAERDGDPALAAEIKSLSTHVQVNAPKEEE